MCPPPRHKHRVPHWLCALSASSMALLAVNLTFLSSLLPQITRCPQYRGSSELMCSAEPHQPWNKWTVNPTSRFPRYDMRWSSPTPAPRMRARMGRTCASPTPLGKPCPIMDRTWGSATIATQRGRRNQPKVWDRPPHCCSQAPPNHPCGTCLWDLEELAVRTDYRFSSRIIYLAKYNSSISKQPSSTNNEKEM